MALPLFPGEASAWTAELTRSDLVHGGRLGVTLETAPFRAERWRVRLRQ
jgi:hypothetical protein